MSRHDMGLEDAVIYVAEPHDRDLFQLYRETWIDGKCVERVPRGLPMPEGMVTETARRLSARHPGSPPDLRSRLRRLGRRAAEAEAERDRGVRDAIAAGWALSDIAATSGLSEGEVTRIAAER
jgi:DNA-binding NarL/FixJ family response regulator